MNSDRIWRVFRCKKIHIIRGTSGHLWNAQQYAIIPSISGHFWFLCKKHWSNIFYTLKQYFMQLAISFIFMFGQFLLQICASGVLFYIVLALVFFWICDIIWLDSMGWRRVHSPLNELHWLHWTITVRSKVLTKSINKIVKIPQNRPADGQYDTKRYCH